MKATCTVAVLLVLSSAATGRKLQESEEKCAGPFDVSNTTFSLVNIVPASENCDAFNGKDMKLSDAVAIFLRLSAGDSDASRLRDQMMSSFPPSKACLQLNWPGHATIGGSNVACTPWGCSGSGRRRHLMQEDDAPGPASNDGEKDLDGQNSFLKATIAGSAVACNPFGCSGLGRRRQLMQEEDAPGPASNDGENDLNGQESDLKGNSKAALSACNGHCCLTLIINQQDADATFV